MTHVLLTSTLYGGEWSDPRPSPFFLEEIAAGILRTGGRVGPEADLDALDKRNKLPYWESFPIPWSSSQ
jgi:hypothetical protein